MPDIIRVLVNSNNDLKNKGGSAVKVHPEIVAGEVFIVKAHQIYCHFGHKCFEGKGICDFVGQYWTPDISFARNNGCTHCGSILPRRSFYG